MALPPSPYGSPPIYLPFSSVEGPLQQSPNAFSTSFGYYLNCYPYAPIVDAGWNDALMAVVPVESTPYHELIDYAMPPLVQDMVIPFRVEKVSPVLLLSGPMILNVVDSIPLTGLSFTVTNMSTSLLAIQLNALLPPATGDDLLHPAFPSNYRFRGLISVVG